jgi:glycosyltransferase involved in cell wall biosynthesis
LRVVLLAETFAKRMGYLESSLPKYMARLGIETHVVTMDLPPYYWIGDFSKTYGGFDDSAELLPGVVERYDGYTLHVLAHEKLAGYMRMIGLREKLKSIGPDIVQTMSPIGWIPLEASFYKLALGYKLFTACHTTASIFPLATRKSYWWNRERLRCVLLRTLPGRFTSFFAEKSYGATVDCADVAVRFFGVPKSKIEVCPLGVDTEIFRPVTTERDHQARVELRHRLGFSESDVVCIYTGRFSEDKNPLLLARAVSRLGSNGTRFRGLFVGNGMQNESIQSMAGCVTHPFVPVRELGEFYRAADIGVWPTQESMSMLDAAACGLPIIVNDTIAAVERIDGNGLKYKLGDVDDLVRALVELGDSLARQGLGSFGAKKMAGFSWETIARRRLQDYRTALAVISPSVGTLREDASD